MENAYVICYEYKFISDISYVIFDKVFNIKYFDAKIIANSLLVDLKAYFSMKPAKKIFSLLGGKIVFEYWLLRQYWAVGPIQI